MKRNYLISIVVMGLIVLSLYSTYAMFTESIEIDQVINMTASQIPLESKIVEYEQVEVNAKENKIIELNINNKTESNLYYGAWYQMVNPEVKEENLIIAKHVNSEDETTGQINVSGSKKVIIVIDNKTNSNVTIYMGVGYSETSSLELPTNRYVISGEYGNFKVNLKASNGTISGGNTITNLLSNGSFENTGWSGCSYNTTYKKYGNYSCALTGTTAVPEVLATNNQSIYLDNTHTYYSRVEAYQTSKTGLQSWQTYWPIAEPSFGSVEFGEANEWHKYSLVANRTSFSSGSYPLRFDYDNRNNNGTVYYDGGMLIDLTASYGSGNEPSKEWLDENIEYFEGTMSNSIKDVVIRNDITFTVTPNTGYEYDSINCDGGSYNTGNNTLTVNEVGEDKICEINFKPITYTVGVTASTGGTVSGSSSQTVNYNGSTTFTVTPSTGYKYSSVSCPSGITGSYNSGNNTLTVSNVTASGTCTVSFTKKTYTVRVSVTNGTSSPTSRTVSHGSSTTFTVTPNSGYEYESLSCIGGSYNQNTKVLTVSNVTSTRTCTIKFKQSGVLATSYIESLRASNPSTMNNDDPDGNVRYMGKNPNNYVRFNNELWRIIGVFNVKPSASGSAQKRVKIIRNTSIGNMAWDSNDVNNWSQASLQEYLNGEYYNTIDSVSQSFVGDTYWNLGGSSTYNDVTASMFYTRERGTTVYSGRPTYWVGKIGLMYPSDYGYATSGGTTTNRQSCLAKELYNWDSSSYSDCKNNDYLYNSSSTQWTLTPLSSNSLNVFNVYTAGVVFLSNANYSHSSASPVLYLLSTVEITGGEGTSENPYTLS